MKKSTKKFLNLTLLVSFISFCICSVLYFSGIFTTLENKLYDKNLRIQSKYFKTSDDFCYIGIDQNSINSATQEKNWGWPWPRKSYAKIVDFLNKGGAKAMIFDIFFTEPSVFGSEDDKIFAESCKNANNVVQVFHQVTNSKNQTKTLFPIEELKNSAKILGNITSSMDKDGVIRRSRISYNFNGTEFPTLGLTPELIDSENIQNDLENIKSKIPTLKDETVLLRYKDFSNFAGYSAWDILKSAENYEQGLESDFIPEDFEDCTVFFMFYAPGLYDICSTPMSQNYPGSGVHMTFLDNYLLNDFISECPKLILLIYSFIFSILGGFLVFFVENQFKRRKIFYFILFLIIGELLNYFITFSLLKSNIFIPAILPFITFSSSYLFVFVLSYILEGKQKQFIKSAFSQYLSPFVIDKIISEPERLKLGGEKRNISIFFSDIENFTSLSEKLSAERLTEILNEYLSELTNIILKSGGTIDKYEGDAIIAFWNAPTDIKNHPQIALHAALQCQQKLKELESYFIKKIGRPLTTRIGINTGNAIVGNMGSNLRFDYTMLGDSVNLTSRLEGLNKQFGTYLMCSESTKIQSEKTDSTLYFRELAKVKVVGKSEAIKIFEPILKEEFISKKEMFLTFDNGLKEFYTGNFDSAISIFESIQQIDKPAQKYIQKCRELKSENIENFDGIWISKSK